MTTQVLGQVRSVSDQTAGTELTVAEGLAGVNLDVEDLEWASEGGGSVIIGATDVRIYDSVDFAALTVHLTAGVSQVWPIGTRVEPNPTSVNRYMEVWTESEDYEDDPEALTARVPNVFRDRMPIGTREADAGEYVIVQREGDVEGEWVFVDFPGEEMVVTLENVDPDTIPHTDGFPPSASPTPTIQGGIGALIVKWNGVGNADPVEYEVHVSTSAAFVPVPGDAATLAGQIAGSSFWIRKLPSGADLDYATDYYVRLISRDDDGTAAPGTVASGRPVQATSGDIAAPSITADHIFGGNITAEKLESVMILASTIILGDPVNQHAEIDSAGMRLKGADGSTVVDLPTNPTKDAVFAGEVLARALTVVEAANIQGIMTLDRGATMRFSSTIANPVTLPTLAPTWDTMTYSKPLAFFTQPLTKRCGFAFDASGSGSQPTVLYTDTYVNTLNGVRTVVLVESKQSDGTVVRSTSLVATTANATGGGVVRAGSFIFALYTLGSSTFLLKLNQSDLSGVSTTNIAADMSDNVYPQLSAYDGTNLLIVDGSSSGFNGLVHKYTTTPTFVSTTTMAGFDIAGGQMAVAESKWWFAGNTAGSTYASGYQRIRSRTTAGAAHAVADDYDFRYVGGGNIGHDGTAFVTGNSQSTQVTKHSNWAWIASDHVNKLWVGYSWYDQNATGGTHETLIGPTASIDLTEYKRSKLVISTPPIPGAGGTDDPNRCRVYANWGNTAPTGGSPTRFSGFLQVEDALTTRSVVTIDLTGTAPENSGTNTFAPGGNESALTSDTGSPLLRSNGVPRVRIFSNTPTANQGVTTGVDEVCDFVNATVIGTNTGDVTLETANDRIKFLIAGDWRLDATARWATAASVSYRELHGEYSVNGTTWTDLTSLGFLSRVAGNNDGFVLAQGASMVLAVAVNSYFRLVVHHDHGSLVDLLDWSLTCQFLGPT